MPYWHIGQKVVCIASLAAPYGPRIEKDEVYTIRDIIRCPHWADEALGFALEEVFCLKRFDAEDCWHEKHFRPLRPTSIECFEELLTSPESQRRGAPARAGRQWRGLMIVTAILLAFFGAEPGVPPLPSVAPPAEARAAGLALPDQGPSIRPHCRAKIGRPRPRRCR